MGKKSNRQSNRNRGAARGAAHDPPLESVAALVPSRLPSYVL